MQYFACKKIANIKDNVDENNYSTDAVNRYEKLDLYFRLKSETCGSELALEAIKAPRSTLYRWAKLYSQYGLAGLENRSKRPHNFRRSSITKSTRNLILSLRKKYPLYGKSKIKVLLCREYKIKVSESTVGRVLKKLILRGIIKPARFYYGHTRIQKRTLNRKYAKR